MDAGIPPAAARAHARLLAADALVIATPEYSHSIPGALKNALDVLCRIAPNSFIGPPVATVMSGDGEITDPRPADLLASIVPGLVAGTERVRDLRGPRA